MNLYILILKIKIKMKINSRVKYGNFFRDHSSYLLKDMVRIPGCEKEFTQNLSNTLNLEKYVPNLNEKHVVLYYEEITNEYNKLVCICIFRIRDDNDELFYLYLNTNMYRNCSTCDGGTEMNHKINYGDNLKSVIEFNFTETEYDEQLQRLLLHENYDVSDNTLHVLSKEIKHLLLFDQLFSLIGENQFFYSKIEHSTIYDKLAEYLNFSPDEQNEFLLNKKFDNETTIRRHIDNYYTITKSEIIVTFISVTFEDEENDWKLDNCKILNFEDKKFNFGYEGWNLLSEDYEKFDFKIGEEKEGRSIIKTLTIKIPCIVMEKYE